MKVTAEEKELIMNLRGIKKSDVNAIKKLNEAKHLPKRIVEELKKYLNKS